MYTPLLFVDGTDDPQSNNPPLGTKDNFRYSDNFTMWNENTIEGSKHT